METDYNLRRKKMFEFISQVAKQPSKDRAGR